MKSRWIVGIVVCGLLLALSPVAESGDHRGGGQDKKAASCRDAVTGMQMMKQAGATSEQMRQLAEMKYEQHLKAVDLRAALEKATMKLRHTLESDEAKVEALHAAVAIFIPSC